MEDTHKNIYNGEPVYISYCHKDKEIAESIIKQLEKEEIQCINDKEEIIPGEDIIDFENMFKRAEFVILIISKSYFCSLHCMYYWSQFISGLKSGRVKGYCCINNEKLSTDNDTFIKEILQYWYGVEVNVMTQFKNGRTEGLHEFQMYAYENSFYMNYIREIPLFLRTHLIIDYVPSEYVYDFRKIFESTNRTEGFKQETDEDKKKYYDFEKTVNADRPIYISYSRCDSSDIEKKIEDYLKEKHFTVRVDNVNLLAGESITRFEKEIGDSKYTILIYSDNYFRSAHCMHEFVQIKGDKKDKDDNKQTEDNKIDNGNQKDLTKHVLCIKNGNFHLEDVDYIMKLKDYWREYGVNVFRKEFEGLVLTEIEEKAKTHNYYKKDLFSLNYFFSKSKYLDVQANEISEAMLYDIYIAIHSWMGFGRVYWIKPEGKKRYSLQEIIDKIQKEEVIEDTIINSDVLEEEGGKRACEMSEFASFFSKKY